MGTTKSTRRMARPPHVNDGTATDASAVQLPDASSLAAAEKRLTKQSLVIELLQREGGASLAAIVKVTDWLPHTARAALTGLRKKGHTIERSSVDGETRYSIAAAAAQ